MVGVRRKTLTKTKPLAQILRCPPTRWQGGSASRPGSLVFAGVRGRGVASSLLRLCAPAAEGDRSGLRIALSEGLVAVIYRELCVGAQGSRMPAYEFLVGTPAVQDLIREDRLDQIDAAIRKGAKYGMQLLDDHLFRLVREKLIKPEEALDKSRAPAAFQARLEHLERGDSEEPGDPQNDPSPARPQTPPPGLSEHAEPGG
jgi:twitching motility protein PilT